MTFGVTPDRPETGYGYIELGNVPSGAAWDVSKFHEKPNQTTAERMLDAGHYVWNAGIFLFRASTMLALGNEFETEMLTAVQAAMDAGQREKNFWHIDEAAWSKIQGQSVDYAIMEKTDQIACVRFSGVWSDLGDWNAVARQLPHDAAEIFLLERSARLIAMIRRYGQRRMVLSLLGLG